jgi:hypothetical protein
MALFRTGPILALGGACRGFRLGFCLLFASIATAGNSAAQDKSGVTVSLTPGTATAAIGDSFQFKAAVRGSSDTAVVWTVAVVEPGTGPGASGANAGTISANGLYQTPYPAPRRVKVTATSHADAAASASAVMTLTAPAMAAGPALRVDTDGVTHTISPLIYGMNGWGIGPEVQAMVKVPMDRWGGDAATRYNYLLDVTNSAADYYFETNPNGNAAYPAVSEFNTQVERDRRYGSVTVATVPLIGYTTRRVKSCGFSVKKYGPQKEVDKDNPDCGKGTRPDGKEIAGNDPSDTSVPIDESFVSGWVRSLVKQFGSAAKGGVAVYELDNEPEFWSGVHRDVHPAYMTYDELTNKGLSYAKAVKAADPTAQVGGPAISSWQNYFYSTADQYSGWHTGPCYCYNGNPADREAHGNVPLLAYYLQAFQRAGAAGGGRLLDYLDLHAYFAAKGTAFAEAGDTALQAARLDSTRVLWDAAYKDLASTDPDIKAKPTAAAPQLIPRMKALVAENYPGTKMAITEYNWGGQESVNGALAQAEVLAVFGREGLDMGALWGAPDPVKQLPGLLAFQIFQSYDGKGSAFGDGSLKAVSADQGRLAVYAARRSKDGMTTVLVLNKTFGDLSGEVAMSTAAKSAEVYRYSQANVGAIVRLADAPVSSVGVAMVFPAQSMTLLVVGR